MNYDEQRKYLRGSRVWGAVVCAAFLWRAYPFAMPVPRAFLFDRESWSGLEVRSAIAVGMILVALAGSMFYTPDYLHLTVTPNKPQRWQVKIRWRIAVLLAILMFILPMPPRGQVRGLVAAAVIALINLIGKRFVSSKWLPLGFAVADLALLIAAFWFGGMDAIFFFFGLAAALHLWMVCSADDGANLALFVIVLIGLGGSQNLVRWHSDTVRIELEQMVLLSIVGTCLLVFRAAGRHKKNRAGALRELTAFTGRSGADVERLWQTSNQQLAANWEAAKLAPDDRAALARWYADNSELYLFAISAYNLEYRRIKSNLFVLDYGRGHAIDYGAGNGELVLEMARRGQRAAYYDVDGATLRFARWRAQQRGLEVEFFTEKPPLARERPFDTVFSFDVLEHIPDLAAELDFLSSLLAPGGQMVFDLPTGATKAHPMHLEHHLDFRKHLEAKGLREKKRWADYIPFRKQEKFVFVK